MESTLFTFIIHTQFLPLNYLRVKRNLSKQNKNTGFIYDSFLNSFSLGIVSENTQYCISCCTLMYTFCIHQNVGMFNSIPGLFCFTSEFLSSNPCYTYIEAFRFYSDEFHERSCNIKELLQIIF